MIQQETLGAHQKIILLKWRCSNGAPHFKGGEYFNQLYLAGCLHVSPRTTARPGAEGQVRRG